MSWFKRNDKSNESSQRIFADLPQGGMFGGRTFCPNTSRGPLPQPEKHHKKKVYIVIANKWDDDYHESFPYVKKVFKHKADAMKYIHNYKGADNLSHDNPIGKKIES